MVNNVFIFKEANLMQIAFLRAVARKIKVKIIYEREVSVNLRSKGYIYDKRAC